MRKKTVRISTSSRVIIEKLRDCAGIRVENFFGKTGTTVTSKQLRRVCKAGIQIADELENKE